MKKSILIITCSLIGFTANCQQNVTEGYTITKAIINNKDVSEWYVSNESNLYFYTVEGSESLLMSVYNEKGQMSGKLKQTQPTKTTYEGTLRTDVKKYIWFSKTEEFGMITNKSVTLIIVDWGANFVTFDITILGGSKDKMVLSGVRL